MKKNEQKPKCCLKEECDTHFIERMDALLDLKTTIKTIEASLNSVNKLKFQQMPEQEKMWIALKAHDDNLIKYTKVTTRKD